MSWPEVVAEKGLARIGQTFRMPEIDQPVRFGLSQIRRVEDTKLDSQRQRWRLPQQHRELLAGMMKDGATRTVSADQRLTVRRICSSPERNVFEPEDFLIAFKLAVVDAANEAGIPPGPERNDFLARLVSTYIEEFYRYPAAGDAAGQSGTQELAAGG